MATSFQSYIDRENIGTSVLKNNVSKTAPGQRGLSAKTFHAPTPRKALGDLGNIQHGTARKIKTPKPSKVKIFDETPKAKTSVKSKKTSFSVLNTHKANKKVLTSDAKVRTKNDTSLPEIENMKPFVDEENDFPTPEYITKLLRRGSLLNPSLLVPQTYQDDIKIPSSHYEYDTSVQMPCFDETIANIIGYDEKPELVETDPLSSLDILLPPLDDIDLSFMS